MDTYKLYLMIIDQRKLYTLAHMHVWQTMKDWGEAS